MENEELLEKIHQESTWASGAPLCDALADSFFQKFVDERLVGLVLFGSEGGRGKRLTRLVTWPA